MLGLEGGGVGNNAVLSALSHAPKDILGIDKDLNVSCGRYSSRRGEKDWGVGGGGEGRGGFWLLNNHYSV